MKTKIIKILFIISFLPYLLILANALVNTVKGTTFIYSTIYGWDAFFITIIAYLYIFAFNIPILPVCIIFELCYVLRNKFKKLKNFSPKKYIIYSLIIGLLLICIWVIYSHSFEIESFIQKINAKQMIKKADEEICINSNEIYYGGIFNIEGYESDYILIDYDNMEIGFLMNHGYDQFWKTKLKETQKYSNEYNHIVNDYFLQTEIPLNSPGEKLLTFYIKENESHRTTAILLIKENGKIYYTDNIKEKGTNFSKFLGLNSSSFFIPGNVKYN